MTDLLAVLKPLKGTIGDNASLSDCEYDHDDEGKPTIAFSIAIANPGSGPLHITLGTPQEVNGRTVAPAKQRIFNDKGGYREIDVGFFGQHVEGPNMIHWHYAGLASMELVDKDGKVVAASDKEAFVWQILFNMIVVYQILLPKHILIRMIAKKHSQKLASQSVGDTFIVLILITEVVSSLLFVTYAMFVSWFTAIATGDWPTLK